MIYDTLANSPELLDVFDRIHSEPWPAFLSRDIFVIKYWSSLYNIFPEYQILFKVDSAYAALANCAPIFWSGNIIDLPEGFDRAMEQSIERQNVPNCLCVLAIVVKKGYTGRGISSRVLKEIKEIARKYGFDKIIVPVRPVCKSQYPHIPMREYMSWKKDELPFDPWLRIHIEAGGRILKEATPSMVVKGTIAQWRHWTGLDFGNGGEYIVDGALSPVYIDLENDIGEYVESNVWVAYEL
ncbi:MAG: GNAT family N-acetyltransferase [FCB group bacterium]|nr:GNAT family N-acetyltransferase [FCB group bacterium]